MKNTYAEIPNLLKANKEINGNSVTAGHFSSVALWDTECKPYIIESYATTIAVVMEDVCILNGTYYSKTTSRLQNIIREIYNCVEITNIEKGHKSREVLCKRLLQEITVHKRKL